MSYDEPDQLDMKVLGFLTTDRLDGDWNSLLFEIRNHEFEEEESDEHECDCGAIILKENRCEDCGDCEYCCDCPE